MFAPCLYTMTAACDFPPFSSLLFSPPYFSKLGPPLLSQGLFLNLWGAAACSSSDDFTSSRPLSLSAFSKFFSPRFRVTSPKYFFTAADGSFLRQTPRLSPPFGFLRRSSGQFYGSFFDFWWLFQFLQLVLSFPPVRFIPPFSRKPFFLLRTKATILFLQPLKGLILFCSTVLPPRWSTSIFHPDAVPLLPPLNVLFP